MTTKEGGERLGRELVDWSDLRTFYAVATAGSMNAAAELMGVTQSAISKRLAQLEGRLGARLLERSPTGIQLTEAGTEALDHVTTMMRASLSLENKLKGLETKSEGEVKIWSNDGILAYCIAPSASSFLAEHPGIRLTMLSDRYLPKQGQGYADIVVGFEQPTQSEVVSFSVATLHYCVFASEEYIATYGAPTGPLDVAGHRVLTHALYAQNPGWKDKTAQVAELVQPSLLTDCSSSLLQAAAGGAGIAVMPSYAARLERRLVALPIPPLASVKLWLSFHEGARRAPRIRTVVTWMRNVFDRRTNPWFRDEYVPPALFGSAGPLAWTDDKAA